MEGASVAQAAKVLGKPFVVIRSLSDTADGQAAESFDEFIIQAGEKSAATLIKMLEIMV
jgi:adenosylhomocysteine nucleosidase